MNIVRLKGSTFTYREERDRDLIRAYREQLSKQKGKIKLTDVLVATVNSPSARFWVSVERAKQMVLRIRSGRTPNKILPEQREKYGEIAKRVELLLAEYPQMDLEMAVIKVVEGGAPKFYITPESAKVIIHNIRKRWRKK